jgi:hypothetical protein
MALKDLIDAHSEWANMPHTETSARLIADALNVSDPRVKVVSRLGGVGAVLRALGPTNGGAFLDALAASSDSSVKWAMVLVKDGSLDFGDPLVRAQIDMLAPGAAATALKALAEIPDPYTPAEVEAARNG